MGSLQVRPSRAQILLILGIGVLAVSTAAILIRLAIAASGLQGTGFSLVLAASRLTLAALVLLPSWPGLIRTAPPRSAWTYAIASGVVLALHFSTWITSLSYTSIAASTTLVTTTPIWVALGNWLWFGEKLTRLSLLGMVLALAGGLIVGITDPGSISAGSQPLLGNGLALVGSWFVSLYFFLGRSAQRRGLSVSHYVAIAYSAAALVLLPIPFLFGASYGGYAPPVYLYILLLALVPQLIGHTSFNWAVRWVSPTLITLAVLFEPVSASLLGYWLFKELPGPFILVGAGLLLAGVALATIGSRDSVPQQKRHPS